MLKYHLIDIYTFIFGMCIGSFVNVCICRLPESTSIIRPGSRCPKCHIPIKWYDNIPVFSYLWLRGKCRGCRSAISLRYPVVEILSGSFALGVYVTFGFSIEAMIVFLFICTLLVVTFIDIDHRIIPDLITLPGIPICFIASLVLGKITPLASLGGILLGGGSLWTVAWGYSLLTGKEGMGGGDIKLLAMIGALIGWKGVLFTIFISSAVGTITGIIVMIGSRQRGKLAVPFGPFLSIGAMLYIFFGDLIIHWYLGLTMYG